ncbi:MAG: hypothetical protein JJ863_39170 [Deltaproteobacteria bacterium]|nr:hypothetical protein [Deltaproteobacteria bacterium]
MKRALEAVLADDRIAFRQPDHSRPMESRRISERVTSGLVDGGAHADEPSSTVFLLCLSPDQREAIVVRDRMVSAYSPNEVLGVGHGLPGLVEAGEANPAPVFQEVQPGDPELVTDQAQGRRRVEPRPYHFSGRRNGTSGLVEPSEVPRANTAPRAVSAPPEQPEPGPVVRQ